METGTVPKKAKGVGSLFYAADGNLCLTKISLGVIGRMVERSKHLSAALFALANIVLDYGIAAIKTTFVTKTLENVLGSMTLLAGHVLVCIKPLVNLIGESIKLGVLDWGCPPVTSWFRLGQHFANTV